MNTENKIEATKLLLIAGFMAIVFIGGCGLGREMVRVEVVDHGAAHWEASKYGGDTVLVWTTNK